MVATAVVVLGASAAVASVAWSRSRPGAAPAIRTETGDLATLVGRLVAFMPRAESSGYRAPTQDQAVTMASAVRDALKGRLTAAGAAVEPFEYQVIRFTDRVTGRRLVVLEERRRPDGSWPHAWGMFVLDPVSRSRLVVEVAHPIDDINTPDVAVRAFRGAGARALMVAGASRFAASDGSSDMAHSPRSAFESVHEALVGPASIVFQPHGYEVRTREPYGDVVISSGQATPQPAAEALRAAIIRAGLTACLYDGQHCAKLGGTTNVEGRATLFVGGQFLHVEMSELVRDDPRYRELVAEAVVAVVAQAAGDASPVP